tara:strand:- start:55 stop:462 length:408 start_codon:yes stop_codon:yes gene_type:complete
MNVCIIVSNFYPKISKLLIKGATDKLKKNNVFNFRIINVPGTHEIPVVISNFIKKYDGFVALGCIIKGETPHFNYLCSSTFSSLINLSVKSKVPIGNGILTCNNMRQALKRADPKKINKGGSAAGALISILKIIK